jgi:S1-C subfamily serine protease
VVQIDAFAGQGSSGSPVFNASGEVVGVVYGGATESAGRIVYAVPAARVRALLPRD